MRVLVTGASGFIGRRLCHALRMDGHEIVGLSRQRPINWNGDSIEAEMGLLELRERDHFQLAILRPPLVYGPDVKANFLSFMRLVECSAPLPVRSLQKRRSLLFVGNLVSAIQACLLAQSLPPQPRFVADRQVLSTPRLARAIAEAFAIRARLFPISRVGLNLARRLSGPAGKVSKLIESLEFDGSDFETELGWTLPYDLASGLKETVEWYRQRQSS